MTDLLEQAMPEFHEPIFGAQEARQIHEIIAQKHETQYLVVGGVVSDIFRNPDTHLDFSVGRAYVPEDFTVSMIRPEDGSMRDYDILLLSKDEELKTPIFEDLKDVTPGAVVSLFTFKEHGDNPKRGTIKEWTTDREIDEDGNIYLVYDKIEQQIGAESMEPWEVVFADGASMNVMHPIGHMMNYMHRSPHGWRIRDVSKVHKLLENLRQHPEFEDEIDKFRDWIDFDRQLAREFQDKKPRDFLNLLGVYITDVNDPSITPHMEESAKAELKYSFRTLYKLPIMKIIYGSEIFDQFYREEHAIGKITAPIINKIFNETNE